MISSADPDQLASSDLHRLLRQGISCSAREELNINPYFCSKTFLVLIRNALERLSNEYPQSVFYGEIRKYQ